MRIRLALPKLTTGIALLLTLLAPLAARADLITLQLPNVPGDARFAANNGLPADSVRVLTVGNAVSNTGADCYGGGGCAGKAVFSNLSIVKKFGASSAPLFLMVALGTRVPTATVTFYRMKQGVPAKYYTITLRDVAVASQKWVGNSKTVDEPDTENIELSYTRITLLDNETGSTACYDARTATPC